jgi:pimeloyl-ACP methyl ester carboxylesterase
MPRLIEEIEAGAPGVQDDRILVLFVPGLGGHRDQWSLIAPSLLAAGMDVGYAARLHSTSSEGDTVDIAAEVSLALADELEDLGYSHIHVVAHSIGCFVALELLNARADLVTSILLINGGLATIGKFLQYPWKTFVAQPFACIFATYLFVLVGVPLPDAVRDLVVRSRLLATLFLGRIVGKRALATKEVRRLLVTNGGQPDIFVALWRNRRGWSRFLEIAPSVKSDVRFLVGDADRLAGLRDTTEMAALLPNASVQMLHGVGHAAPLEAPEAVLEEIMVRITGATV